MSREIQTVIEAAQGYLLLGMIKESWQEVKKLTPQEQLIPEVLDLRIGLLMQEKRWTEALEILEPLCHVVPDNEGYFIHAAYCLHELKQTKEARELLLRGPDSLMEQPLFYYNLGCYEACLGEIHLAKLSLERCFKLDNSFRKIALDDSDLEIIKKWLLARE